MVTKAMLPSIRKGRKKQVGIALGHELASQDLVFKMNRNKNWHSLGLAKAMAAPVSFKAMTITNVCQQQVLLECCI